MPCSLGWAEMFVGRPLQSPVLGVAGTQLPANIASTTSTPVKHIAEKSEHNLTKTRPLALI